VTANGITQIVLYLVILTALAYPLGAYMTRVYTGTLRIPRWLAGAERGFYRLVGTRAEQDQGWKHYAVTALVFMFVFSILLYLLLRLQGHLPLNPDGLASVNPWVAMNTTASFVTNTNWQYYGGEYTMSYLSQMAGLAVQNFVSAALGMAVLAAVIRGFARRSASTVGNFWVDLYRSLVYILLPLALILAVLLVSQGVVQTFHGAATATTLEGGQQTIARGPAASQIAIKQLGTNGGGFYNSNSAVPFESSNPFTNLLEMLSILLIPVAQVFMFGRMVGSRRQALPVYAAMMAMTIIGIAVALPAEQHGSQVLRDSGVNITAGDGSSGGNMSDKEVRYGIASTVNWAVVTTNASNGSVNGGHDALTATGGAVPITNMFTGEVIWGGVGSGLYGMFFYIVIAVFVAGLMVGRTPEYLGKKIEAREIKLSGRGPLRADDGSDPDGDRDLDRSWARVDLRSRSARLLGGALRLRLAVEQQRERIRRVRSDRVLHARRLHCPVARPVRAARRGARPRRLSRGQEDGSTVGGHVPDRRRHVCRPPRRCRDPHGRADDLPRAHARADRGGAPVIQLFGRSAIAVVVLTLVFGIAYPVVFTGFAQVAFSDKADGSLVERDGSVVGSRLAAQAFTKPEYFHPRPSATSPEYNAAATTFANLGPTNPELAKAVRQRVLAILQLERPYNPGLTIGDIPVDAVTTSASGIDPHISPANARLQAARVAKVRGLSTDRVSQLIDDNTDGRWLGIFGEPGVNVLELNLALDEETS